MPDDAYGLGVDIGASTVAAAVHVSGQLCPEPVFRCDMRSALAAWAAGRALTAEATDLPAFPHTPAEVLDRTGGPVPLGMGDRAVPAADALAGVVVAVAAVVAADRGRPPAWTAVAVPPSWNGHRRNALAEALHAAGVLEGEPVSAAVALVSGQLAAGGVAARDCVVVVDVGSSTTDLAVVSAGDDGQPAHRAVPPPPLRWGGRNADDAVLGHVRRCLEQPVTAAGPAARARAAALRVACTAAKEALSVETEAQVAVDPAWSGTPVRLTREELEDLVREDVDRLAVAAADAVAAAGSVPADLTAVVLAGGAGRMPLVVERLSAALCLPVLTAGDPALDTAAGAARLASDEVTRRGADQEPALEVASEALEAAVADTPVRRPVARRPAAPGQPGPARASSARRPPSRQRSITTARLALVGGLFAGVIAVPAVLAQLVGADAFDTPAQTTLAAEDPAAEDAASAVVQRYPGASVYRTETPSGAARQADEVQRLGLAAATRAVPAKTGEPGTAAAADESSGSATTSPLDPAAASTSAAAASSAGTTPGAVEPGTTTTAPDDTTSPDTTPPSLTPEGGSPGGSSPDTSSPDTSSPDTTTPTLTTTDSPDIAATAADTASESTTESTTESTLETVTDDAITTEETTTPLLTSTWVAA